MPTLYLNNLNEKVSPNTLRHELQHIFEEYDPILIELRKTLRLKGQAFVSFRGDVDDIIKKFNNYKLLDKNMKVTKAKSDSDGLFSQKEVEQRKSERKLKVKLSKPNKKLLLTDLTITSDLSERLHDHFEKFPGFIELRLIQVRNLAFIEFETLDQSKNCLESTTDLKTFGDNARLDFAKV